MKTLLSNDALDRAALCVCFLSALPIAQGGKLITIPMMADHWRLNSGQAALKGITFSDGTIEFDVNTIGRGAPPRKNRGYAFCKLSRRATYPSYGDCDESFLDTRNAGAGQPTDQGSTV
jgi:hypothetical protein